MRRRLGILFVLGVAGWGCDKPEIVQMTPPGISPRRFVATEEPAEALGERSSQGVVSAPVEQKKVQPAPPAGGPPAKAAPSPSNRP